MQKKCKLLGNSIRALRTRFVFPTFRKMLLFVFLSLRLPNDVLSLMVAYVAFVYRSMLLTVVQQTRQETGKRLVKAVFPSVT